MKVLVILVVLGLLAASVNAGFPCGSACQAICELNGCVGIHCVVCNFICTAGCNIEKMVGLILTKIILSVVVCHIYRMEAFQCTTTVLSGNFTLNIIASADGEWRTDEIPF